MTALESVAAFEILDHIEYDDDSPQDGGGYSDVYKGLLYRENFHPQVRTQFNLYRMVV